MNRVWGFVCLVAVLPLTLSASSYGPIARVTGAPGDKPFACASAGCHTNGFQDGPINVAGGSVKATFSGGGVYTPGQSISITVTVSDPQNTWAGFQMTARPQSNLANGAAGHFNPGSGQFVLCENNTARAQHPGNTCPQSAPIEFIEHTQPSQQPWTFTWTAPDTNIGPVHFYVAGNAVNNNLRSDGGDHVYTKAYVLQPSGPTCQDQTPTISAAIVASGFGGSSTISAANWIEIYGKNFTTTPYRDWLSSDFTRGVAPTELEGVSVQVDNRDAFVRFISPGQVNIFSPDDANTGPVSVQVTNCAGTSAAYVAQKATLSPGMLAAAPSNGQRKLYSFDPTTFAVQDQVPAGSTTVLFGIGFGPTDPAVAAGTIVLGANHVTGDLKITIGGMVVPDSDITYKGLLPPFVGLYQFNVVVPDLPTGTQTVEVTIDGVAVPGPLIMQVTGSS